jgi:hypothetical protein
MTYSNSSVGYWVGQANDTSAAPPATRPPGGGWVNGQRWSVTSSQWQRDQSSAMGLASDTSTGRHPPGWVFNQLWSSTASQWMSDRDTQAAAATDTSTGAHPPGWASGQLWSTTAAQWKSAYDTSQSQLATANSQLATANANYNALLNGLNNPDGMQSQGFSISHVSGGSEVGIGTFTFARSGHHFVSVVANVHGPNVTQNNSTSTLRLAGVLVTTMNQTVGGSGVGARDWQHAYVVEVDVTAGQTISLFYNSFTTGNPTTGTATVYAHFVPTSSFHN